MSKKVNQCFFKQISVRNTEEKKHMRMFAGHYYFKTF